MLAQQKAMMQAKRAQLDGIIQAINETEDLLQGGECDWDSLVRVIQAIQMEQNRDWVKKYFTPEQLEQMQGLSEQSYSEEAREKMAARMGEWTEADQERASAQWASVNADMTRLASAECRPGEPRAQDVVRRYSDLIAGFTGGDPEIASGLRSWWENHDALPETKNPCNRPTAATRWPG